MALPTRKHPRLKNYDYSQCGCYHITICTKDRRPILAHIIPAESYAVQAGVRLSRVGYITDHYIQNIARIYDGVFLDKYVIMPNHIHLLISLREDSAVSIPNLIRSLKRMVSKEVGESIWQSSYYDVVIRNNSMYQCEWTYIDNNPDKWAEDELYVL